MNLRRATFQAHTARARVFDAEYGYAYDDVGETDVRYGWNEHTHIYIHLVFLFAFVALVFGAIVVGLSATKKHSIFKLFFLPPLGF